MMTADQLQLCHLLGCHDTYYVPKYSNNLANLQYLIKKHSEPHPAIMNLFRVSMFN